MSNRIENDFANLRILLVDDELACMAFLVLGLESAGVIVTQASCAEEAMEILKHSYFDAIATDMNLPGADGIALLRYIRENCGDVPVILITGYSSVRSAVDALKLGAQDYLAKPLENADVLLGALWKAVEYHRVTVRNKALQERVLRAEKMESLANIAGGVAHDLNNILSPIVSLPDLLKAEIEDMEEKTGIDASEIKGDLDLMKMSGLRAAGVVRDLMASSGRGNHERRNTNLNTLISTCVQSREIRDMAAAMPDVKLEAHLSSEECTILCSEPHVTRAIANLIRNAFEAMDSRITGVTLGEKKVFISTEKACIGHPVMGHEVIQEGDYIKLRVADTGIGVEKGTEHKIFEPFFTTKKESGRSGGGLGLSVVYGVVKDHGGFVDMRNEKGAGAVFDIYFPVAVGVDDADPSSSVLRTGDEKILVVDDAPSQRIVARRMLEKLGYNVTIAANGREALQIFRDESKKGIAEPFDLIILDMIMEEDFDGLTTLERIRQIYPGQKAIIASGFAPTGRIQSAISMGAGWLPKPYTMESLSAGLASLLTS